MTGLKPVSSAASHFLSPLKGDSHSQYPNLGEPELLTICLIPAVTVFNFAAAARHIQVARETGHGRTGGMWGVQVRKRV